MNSLFIKGTSKTPEIEFTPGNIKISGRSIPEDSLSFYQPVVKWIEEYITLPELSTKVSISIEYINSGSNRFLYNIIKLIEDCYSKGNDVSISWYYEEDDDTIKNLGQDFKALFKVPINLIVIT
ncbi:DUF1987 domain-containing protein [Perlabentimonas gracilis]|uniref:DUF1987 domain-containing protein n=1 Tax=Perlabentimonas gracilis TaxID=2715279 RepID=UPI00140B42EB|nr:DUF1987 domain-containing protein [Perlabentimonas gracilis]NHB67786.1 DUF1987 domain-containing protein [Perlabentimonas gracilis]